MTRICPYPAVAGNNPYLALYYRALEPHGFALAPALEYSDRFLRDHLAQLAHDPPTNHPGVG